MRRVGVSMNFMGYFSFPLKIVQAGGYIDSPASADVHAYLIGQSFLVVDFLHIHFGTSMPFQEGCVHSIKAYDIGYESADLHLCLFMTSSGFQSARPATVFRKSTFEK
jgi:hypothetical protein